MENNPYLGHGPMYAPKTAYFQSEKKHFNKIALIDADKLKHLVAYDVSCDLKQGRERDPYRLEYHIEERLAEIFRQFSAAGYIFCFSGKSHDTFRAKLAVEKEYKGNRKNDPSFYEGKIEDMANVVRHVRKSHPVLLFADLEADDLLCYLQTDSTFIFSNDKDLNQIPGLHFCTQLRDLKIISEEEAFGNLMYQMLIGDSTDCITGIPGVGPKSARKIMDEVPLKHLPGRILHEYHVKYGLTKGTDAFVENWSLVKLRMDRGTWFNQKYESAKSMVELMRINSGI